MKGPLARWRRSPLWIRLAALAALGVIAMHAVHLTLGARVATRALASEEERLGRTIARLVARDATDPLLLGDVVALHEVVTGAAARRDDGVVYCLVVRDGAVIASSFDGPPPPALVALRRPGDRAAIVVRDGRSRILDVAEPILRGDLGEVRLGLDMTSLAATRQKLGVHLGLLALAVIAAGLVAAILVGRSVAQPISDILAAADRFDPAGGAPAPAVAPRGSGELAVLGEHFNRMMARLTAAHAEQLRVQQKSVEAQRLAALGALVAGVAHEVNNPLAGLKNCVRRLERAELPAAKREEYLALMDEGLDRIQDIVRRLLDFGRPDATALSPCDAAELARDALRLVRPLFGKRGVRCVVEGDDDLSVLADRRKIAQALLNLLLNAADVTPDGGRIALRLRRRGDGLIGVAVADQGPGIAPELRDRVLDPFFTTKPEGQGTGLGLPVTRSIAVAHGGELGFEFPPAGGTIATLWLRPAPSPPARLSA